VKAAEKILFIGHVASRSGAPLLLLHFLKWLRQNSTLEFELLLKSGGELVQEYSQVCPTRCLEDLLPKSPQSRVARLGWRAARRIGWFQPPVFDLNSFYPVAEFPTIYANTIATADLAAQLAVPGRRIVQHVHELSYTAEYLDAVDSLKKTIPVTAAYIAVSRAVRDYLAETIGIPAEKIQVIHGFPLLSATENPQNETRSQLRQRLGIGPDAFLVGMCGTAEWRKGTDLFVQLALQVKKIIGPAKCHFVWLGGNRQSHREALYDVAKAGLPDICHFIPAVTNPEIYFNAFDLFALTSREDPFSLAMLEAAANGLPVVCFAGSGGAAELVEDDAGVIVPYLDVSAMAQACVELLTDETRRKELGKNARAKVQKRFTLAIQGPKMLAVLESAARQDNGQSQPPAETSKTAGLAGENV
jgi:glycosyltransferase involved in cell wall biosynthesis